jgi:hypothetical protein
MSTLVAKALFSRNCPILPRSSWMVRARRRRGRSRSFGVRFTLIPRSHGTSASPGGSLALVWSPRAKPLRLSDCESRRRQLRALAVICPFGSRPTPARRPPERVDL